MFAIAREAALENKWKTPEGFLPDVTNWQVYRAMRNLYGDPLAENLWNGLFRGAMLPPGGEEEEMDNPDYAEVLASLLYYIALLFPQEGRQLIDAVNQQARTPMVLD